MLLCVRLTLLTALLTLPLAASAQTGSRIVISGSNDQSVSVSGSINNTARSGGTAKVNIGSISGSQANVGSNRQSVTVNGSVQNQASGAGSKAIINIGSVSDE